jgi:hypothetical protein
VQLFAFSTSALERGKRERRKETKRNEKGGASLCPVVSVLLIRSRTLFVVSICVCLTHTTPPPPHTHTQFMYLGKIGEKKLCAWPTDSLEVMPSSILGDKLPAATVKAICVCIHMQIERGSVG